jgi:hypothetical protein
MKVSRVLFRLRGLITLVAISALLMATAISLLRPRARSVLMEGVDIVTESERMERESEGSIPVDQATQERVGSAIDAEPVSPLP